MSDRRDRVARALYELTAMFQVGQIAWGDVHGTMRDLFLREADAAIAAMQDDETTEAEIDAAHRAFWGTPDGVGLEGARINMRNAMRSALIAARKARP